MEIQLDHANKNNSELVKTLKRLQQQIKVVIWEGEELITNQATPKPAGHYRTLTSCMSSARIEAWEWECGVAGNPGSRRLGNCINERPQPPKSISWTTGIGEKKGENRQLDLSWFLKSFFIYYQWFQTSKNKKYKYPCTHHLLTFRNKHKQSWDPLSLFIIRLVFKECIDGAMHSKCVYRRPPLSRCCIKC